ncbi:protein kinase [Nonomuraea sp. NPDC050663]|uniref:protein kinase domain-containing protein n=1 Tax=Nonomuraea sp. NPDC050663 TaxID=3364370 RepID=UPI0037A67834
MTGGDLGDRIPGYRLIEPVGQGGFAIVYRALNERLGRTVAVKILSVAGIDERALRNFRRELEVTSRLSDHPNIVTALDTGTTAAGRPFIAMDFYEGGSLYDRLRAAGGLPVQETLHLGIKVAGALAAVHETGVFHGDVKPQNILLSRYGEPALADFGVARMLDVGQLSSNTLNLTPHHAAPEVLHGSPQSVASDVYALGSTLYQLLSGRPAFYDPADAGVTPLLLRVISQPLPPLQRPDVPAGLRQLIERAMAKDPAARHRDATTLARELQEFQRASGQPVTSLPALLQAPQPLPQQPVPPQAPTRATSRKRTWPIVTASVAAAAIAVAAAVILTRDDPATGRRPVAAESPGMPTQPVAGTSEPTASPAARKARKPVLETVSLTPAVHTLRPKQTVRLSPEGTTTADRPADLAKATVVYESSAPAVASVDASGLVTALKAGTAQLTVRVTAGDRTHTATTTVRVAVPEKRIKTIKVPVTASADVRSGSYANAMFPTCSVCEVKGAGKGFWVRESYFGFDLGSVKAKPAEITSVTLHVFVVTADGNGSDADLDVHVLGDAWKAMDVTWNSKPALGAQLGTLHVDRTGRWHTLNITSYARSELGGRLSLGFADDRTDGLRTHLSGVGSGKSAAYLEIRTS